MTDLVRITLARKDSKGRTKYYSKNIKQDNLNKYGKVSRNRNTGESIYARKIKIKTKSGKIINKAKIVNRKELFRTPEGYYTKYEPKNLVPITIIKYDSIGEKNYVNVFETEERIKLGYVKRGKVYVRNNKPFVTKANEDIKNGIPLPTRFLKGSITFRIFKGEDLEGKPQYEEITVDAFSKTQRRDSVYSKADMLEQAVNFAVYQLIENKKIPLDSDKAKQLIVKLDLDLVRWS